MDTFWQSFLEDVEVFKQKTKELSRNDLLKLTQEPGGTASINTYNPRIKYWMRFCFHLFFQQCSWRPETDGCEK